MVLSPTHSLRASSLAHRAASTAPSPEPQDVWDRTVRNEYLLGGLRYGRAKAEGLLQQTMGTGLSESPAVDIHTPLLVMPGFIGPEGQFQPLLDHLTADGANGGRPYFVQDGQVFEDYDCTRPAQPNPEARVFRIVLHDIQDGPEEGADQLEQAKPAVRAFCRRPDLDVAAHSQGGLAARVYAERGHSAGKLMMVGTPNQGSRAAELSNIALKNDIFWASSMAGLGPAAAPALEWMTPGNPKLSQLNDNIQNQIAHFSEMLIVGNDGFVSPVAAGRTGPGDGLISAQALTVGDVEVKMVGGAGSKCHYTMMNDPDIFAEMVDYFGWTPRGITE